MKKTILEEAKNIAISKIENHPEYDNYIHYTFIVKNNKLLGYGCNMRGEPPVTFGYHERLNGGRPKLHSEFVAYKKMKGLLKGEAFEIINIRLNRKGEMKLSAPCNCCMNFLKETDCKNIYYSTDEGFEKLR